MSAEMLSTRALNPDFHQIFMEPDFLLTVAPAIVLSMPAGWLLWALAYRSNDKQHSAQWNGEIPLM
jgi:hypothetical protein